MFVAKMPYFSQKSEWTYIDPRVVGRARLTDKATPKVVKSYVDYLAHYSYSYMNDPDAEEKLKELAKTDIEDFKKNKNRYTFEVYNDIQYLVAIDGKSLED